MIRKILQFSWQDDDEVLKWCHGKGKERIDVRGVVNTELIAPQLQWRLKHTFRTLRESFAHYNQTFSTANSVIAMRTLAICPLYA